MGFLDNLLGKKSDSKNAAAPAQAAPAVANVHHDSIPFSLKTSFRPVRLKARSENSCELLLGIRNISDSDHMCSIVVEIPKSLGFDGMGIHKTKELRLGSFAAGASKDLSVTVSANNQTPAGNYRIFVTAYSHYRDYTHVLNSVRKFVELRVV